MCVSVLDDVQVLIQRLQFGKFRHDSDPRTQGYPEDLEMVASHLVQLCQTYLVDRKRLASRQTDENSQRKSEIQQY